MEQWQTTSTHEAMAGTPEMEAQILMKIKTAIEMEIKGATERRRRDQRASLQKPRT